MNNAKAIEMYELQIKAYQNQLKILKDANEGYRTIRHDMKHHMIILADYIDKGENEKALEYLKRTENYVENFKNYVETGNAGIDSILNYMAGRAESISGQVMMDVHMVPDIAVDDFDMSCILGNLLMNACEAMDGCEQKKLEVFLSYDRGLLYLCIKNTYDGFLVQKNGKIVTRKKDSDSHGIGLASVRKAVRKYDGNMKIHFDKKEFWVDITMYAGLRK